MLEYSIQSTTQSQHSKTLEPEIQMVTYEESDKS